MQGVFGINCRLRNKFGHTSTCQRGKAHCNSQIPTSIQEEKSHWLEEGETDKNQDASSAEAQQPSYQDWC